MRTTSRLGNAVIAALGGLLVFLLGIGGITTLMLSNERAMLAAQERRFRSYLLADELRQSSDDLTRLARTYVVTGDPRFRAQYEGVLEIRNGARPRPVSPERIYWDFIAVDDVKPRPDGAAAPLQDLMRAEGFTTNEFDLLRESQANSDGLVALETEAMNAVAAAATRKPEASGEIAPVEKAPVMPALRMHGADYHREKARIMAPIDRFFGMVEQRTADEVQKHIDRSRMLVRFLLGLIGLAVASLLAMGVAIFRTVIGPVPRHSRKPLRPPTTSPPLPGRLPPGPGGPTNWPSRPARQSPKREERLTRSPRRSPPSPRRLCRPRRS